MGVGWGWGGWGVAVGLFVVAVALFCLFVLLNTLLIACGKFGSPHWGSATESARAALPSPTSECSICSLLVCSSKGTYGAQCLGVLT